MSKIRPLNEWLHIEVVAPPWSGSIVRVKEPDFHQGIVLAAGPNTAGIKEGDKVVFATEHMRMHSTGRRLRWYLKNRVTEAVDSGQPPPEDSLADTFLVKWYDCLMVLEPGAVVEINGAVFS